jgi:hypothetical protein
MVRHHRDSQASHLSWVLLANPHGVFPKIVAGQARTSDARTSSHLSWLYVRGGLEKLPNGVVRLNGRIRIIGATKP